MNKWCGKETLLIEDCVPTNGLYLIDTRICDHEVGANSRLTYRQFITAVNYITFGDELQDKQIEMNSWGWCTIELSLMEADMLIKDFTYENHKKLASYIDSKGWDW